MVQVRGSSDSSASASSDKSQVPQQMPRAGSTLGDTRADSSDRSNTAQQSRQGALQAVLPLLPAATPSSRIGRGALQTVVGLVAVCQQEQPLAAGQVGEQGRRGWEQQFWQGKDLAAAPGCPC